MKNTVELTNRLDCSTLSSTEDTIVHVLTDIRAPQLARPARPPMKAVFVLDASFSMMGEPIEQLRAATAKLVSLLSPEDSVGVIGFSGEARVIAELVRLREAAQKRLTQQIQRFDVFQGGTNIEAGLRAAASMVSESTGKERALVLLLSDGQPNMGVKSVRGLAQLSHGLRSKATISTFGFGDAHDEKTLIAVAEAAGGRYHFIGDPERCASELAAGLGAQLDTFADALEMDIQLAEGVELLRVLGQPSVRDARGGAVCGLPSLSFGSSRRVVARLRVSAGKKPTSLGRIELRYRDAAGELARVESSISAPWGTQSRIDTTLIPEVLLARGEEARAEATTLADSGQYARALGVLETAHSALVAAPGFVLTDGSPLSELVEQLIDDIALFSQVPDQESYRAFRRGQRLEGGGQMGAGQKSGVMGRALLDRVIGNLPKVRLEMDDGSIVVLQKPQSTMGRSPSCDIRVMSSKVSRQAASLTAVDGGLWVEDLGSANGVYVKGERIQRMKLGHGDVFHLSDLGFRVRMDP